MINKILFISIICFEAILKNSINLENAYKKNSIHQLSLFFDEWNEKSNNLFLKNKTLNKDTLESNAYDLFNEFFDPIDNKLGKNLERQKYITKLTKYIIVQNELLVYLTNYFELENIQLKNEINIKYNLLKIKNFTPKPKNITNKILYSDSYYRNILKKYLLADIDQYNRLTFNFSKKYEVINRIKYLNNYLRIFPSHWYKYLYVEDHPFVSKIYFNKNMTEAIIFYEVLYQSGEAIYKKINNKWKFIKSKINFSE